MKVVILCGGEGTRIRAVSETLPKPMIAVGQYPILWHIMKFYAGLGHSDFVLCLGYKGTAIKEFFLNYEANVHDFRLTLGAEKHIEFLDNPLEEDWRILFADTGHDSMTGARINRIRKYVADEDNFMITYGDGLGDVDLDAAIKFHRDHGRILTVTGVHPPGRFGEMDAEAAGKVIAFNEKPQAAGGWISGGFFIARREIFEYLDERADLVLEEEPFRALVRDGEMMVFNHHGFWQCMDTYRDFRLLNQIWGAGDAPWRNW
ncbi:MAG: glucose-1-phosphate cytidylyltransferase [Proteobacteria bacterium]|nr:glucose-1-phosphate cytidylyltransferase [Pseudomonadota bacterium]